MLARDYEVQRSLLGKKAGEGKLVHPRPSEPPSSGQYPCCAGLDAIDLEDRFGKTLADELGQEELRQLLCVIFLFIDAFYQAGDHESRPKTPYEVNELHQKIMENIFESMKRPSCRQAVREVLAPGIEHMRSRLILQLFWEVLMDDLHKKVWWNTDKRTPSGLLPSLPGLHPTESRPPLDHAHRVVFDVVIRLLRRVVEHGPQPVLGVSPAAYYGMAVGDLWRSSYVANAPGLSRSLGVLLLEGLQVARIPFTPFNGREILQGVRFLLGVSGPKS